MKNKLLVSFGFLLITLAPSLFSSDLDEIKKRGELRHIGVPYSNFVSGLEDGLDVEIVKGFAKHLGLKYKFVASSWSSEIGDLTGQNVAFNGNSVAFLEKVEIKGDLIANGMTVLDWRKEVINFSKPTFPSGIWLLAKADSIITPIKPTDSIEKDITLVKKSLSGRSLLAIENTCLDPKLYNLKETTEANIILEKNEKLDPINLIPMVMKNIADTALADFPDALVALEKWPGEVKVIGPISQKQTMATAFRKTSPELLAEFNKYLEKIRNDGSYNKLVKKYYPDVFDYYGDFFK